MAQSWLDLLFAHWPVSTPALERVVPQQLTLDAFDGQTWIAVTPFEVRNLRLRPTLPVPWLSRFPEINVRTYVTYRGKPGIYFFSLDAARTAAVHAARKFYRLPYFRANVALRRRGGEIRYHSDRVGPERSAPPAAFHARYRPLESIDPGHGTLERWLTERYCLYTVDEQQRVLSGDIHHPPWRLCRAEAQIEHNSMTSQIGIELTGRPLLHFAQRQDVVFWPLRAAE